MGAGAGRLRALRSAPRADPAPPADDLDAVLRGGSWTEPVERARTWTRFRVAPSLVREDVGFRLVIPVDQLVS